MANTLTGLIQYIYDTLDVVSNEATGMIGAVSLANKAEEVALNQDISYDITAVSAVRDITPAATPPALDSAVTAAGTMRLTKSRSVPFNWTGDDEARVGVEAKNAITNNKFAQAFRALRNEIEADLAALHLYASRAYCAHPTTPAIPFSSNLAELAQLNKILTDNGAPLSGRSLVMNTTAGAAVRSLVGFGSFQADSMLKSGVLVDAYGMQLRESGKIVNTTTVGNNTGGYVVNGAHAIGANSVTLKTGSGTVLAGDVITIGANTAIKYVVQVGLAAPGSIIINAPGLMTTLNDGDAVVIVGVCARNFGFTRDAIHLLSRLPKQPTGGDMALDAMAMVDPVSGLPFRVAMYKGYHANQFEIGISWGVKMVKSNHCVLLLGQ